MAKYIILAQLQNLRHFQVESYHLNKENNVLLKVPMEEEFLQFKDLLLLKITKN